MRRERSEADLAFIIQATKNYVRFTWKKKKGSLFLFWKKKKKDSDYKMA